MFGGKGFLWQPGGAPLLRKPQRGHPIFVGTPCTCVLCGIRCIRKAVGVALLFIVSFFFINLKLSILGWFRLAQNQCVWLRHICSSCRADSLETGRCTPLVAVSSGQLAVVVVGGGGVTTPRLLCCFVGYLKYACRPASWLVGMHMLCLRSVNGFR